MSEGDPNPSCIDGIKVIYHELLGLLCSTKRNSHTPIETMLNKLGWLSINQLASEIRLIEVWKGLNQENYCLNDLFEKAETNNGITRSAGLNKLKNVFKSKLRDNSFAYPSIQLWNSAPANVTTEIKESRARTAIRNFVKTLPI